MYEKKLVARHNFNFNPKDNGGEGLLFITTFLTDEENVSFEQELILQSYFNSASFKLGGIKITPTILRELANQLEEAFNEYERIEE